MLFRFIGNVIIMFALVKVVLESYLPNSIKMVSYMCSYHFVAFWLKILLQLKAFYDHAFISAV